MNHYDGPAFYRKFVHDGTVNKNQKLEEIRKNKQRYSKRSSDVTGFSRDVQRANFNDFKPVKTKASHIDLQNNPIAKITADFKPRRHYGTPSRPVISEMDTSNEFEKISDHYHRLTSELSLNDDEVTLLDSSKSSSSNDVGEHREGTLHFKLDSDDTTDSLTSSASNDEFSRLATDHFATSTDDDQAPKETSLSASQESSMSNGQSSKVSVSTSSSSSSDSLSLAPNDVESDSASSENSKSELNSDIESSDQSSNSESNDQSTSLDQKSLEESNSNQTSSGPLGHDFSSIMHDEGQDIKKNLTLFNSSESNVKSSQSDNAATPSSESSDLTNDSESDLVDSDSNSHEISNESNDNENSLNASDSSFGQRPDFVAQNPTNVQPSSDFDDHDSDEEEHHSIQPTVISDYKFPDHELLVAPKHYNDQGLDNWILEKAQTLNKTLRAFHVNAQVVDWTNGPTVTQFQVKLHLGVKVSKINHLSDDLKMALAAKDIRIQAPIPGKTTCGIEIPNPKPRPVMLSEVVNSKTFRNSKSDLTIALGVDLTGKPRVTDLRKMPHGLIAGATGSGKSVFINCMLISLMYKATPQELKMILIDPKAVEFAPYNGIPYLLSPVISEPKQAAASLKWATKEMNERYEKLAAAGVRNIEQFNKKAEQNHKPQMKMPYILIVIDELADLMMVAGDEIETYIVRITQKARAAGIHLVVATQRPSVDVITGTMKNNIPTRVAFMVSSQVDSRTIIDQSGAERLLGKGDMLYLGNGSSHPIRLQGCYVSNQEIDKVAGFARHQEPAHYAFHPGSLLKHVSRMENQDKLMPQVLAYIAKEKTVSTSKLQRVFSIGYNRSAKIIDDLEQHGYISGQEGSKPRDVYLTEKDYKKLNL